MKLTSIPNIKTEKTFFKFRNHLIKYSPNQLSTSKKANCSPQNGRKKRILRNENMEREKEKAHSTWLNIK